MFGATQLAKRGQWIGGEMFIQVSRFKLLRMKRVSGVGRETLPPLSFLVPPPNTTLAPKKPTSRCAQGAAAKSMNHFRPLKCQTKLI